MRDAQQHRFQLTLEVKLQATPAEQIAPVAPTARVTIDRGAGLTGSVDAGSSGSSSHSANDDRSDSMNPNIPAYHAAMNNRGNQLNPNNSAYWSSRRQR